jgi:flagellar hook-associated protein 2
VTSSVDGLVSGLSTSSLITQLMTVEAAPQARLKAKVSTAQTAVASYQSVNGRLSALKTASDNLSQLSTWRGITATSSSSAVTATALTGTNGAAGTTTFDVASLATSQITTARVGTSGDITGNGTITINIGPLDGSTEPVPHVIDISKDQSAKGVAEAINAAGIGVKAAIVTTGGAQNILQLSGTKTGIANAFTVGDFDPPLTDIAAAGNALLKIGGGEDHGGYNVTSDTNTFTGLMPGVSLTVNKEETNVTITAASDVSGMAGKLQALVDAANATLTEIGAQTAYDPSTKTGSPLTGDFSVRQMSQTILGAISKGLSYDDPNWVKPDDNPDATPDKINFGSLAQLGVQLDSAGKLTFDSAKFTSAYNDDPSKIQQAGVAFADQFEKLAGDQTTNVSSVITGRNSEIDTLDSQISDWDIRLAAKKGALQKQYSDLEVALGKLKDQSTWLSGQLAGLS